MADSAANGVRYHEGDIDWDVNKTAQYYKANLVDPELARPPQADVSSYMWRAGTKMHFVITVTNRSGVTLYAPANGAAVTGVVYEDVIPNVFSSTSRVVVGEGTQAINTALPNGASATYTFDTTDLGVTAPIHTVNWSNVHGVAFVDYRPGGAAGKTVAYDMLQAAMATYYPQPVWLSVSATSVTKWAVQGQDPVTQSEAIQLTGSPSSASWTATKSAPWLSLSALSGTFPATLTVTVNSTGRVPGLYQDTVHITVPATSINPAMSQDIAVTLVVDVSPPKLMYLPSIQR